MHLISEDEARRVYFPPESRPTASQWKEMRRRYSLPALFLEKGVFYWTDELEESLAQAADLEQNSSRDGCVGRLVDCCAN
ncbi:MAG: hypothetical protein GWP68_08605 [Verrucomicrobiaceae bacterium]|jgi:hypothetical protein|nr:hypothetical protein [Verrucomicrobiaceae bacterium]